MDRGAWQATVHGVAESWNQLSLSLFFLETKLCTSFGAGRVGRVGGRSGRKKAYYKTIILAFGFVMMLNLLLLYFRFTDVKYFCLKYTTSAGKT